MQLLKPGGVLLWYLLRVNTLYKDYEEPNRVRIAHVGLRKKYHQVNMHISQNGENYMKGGKL